MKKEEIIKQDLQKLYWEDNWSLKQLAKKYNVCKSTMHNWFKKYNIPTRTATRDRNYIGQVFDKLTVIEKLPDKGKYLCKCQCGNKVIRQISILTNNSTGHCCEECRKKIVSDINKKDITNQKFGLLTALYPIDQQTSDGSYYWHCKCECGNEKDVPIDRLTSLFTKSCGCLLSLGEQTIKEILIKNNIKFETQKMFEECRFPNTNKKARFDFYLPEYKCLIEFDGIQHFEFNKGWTFQEDLSKIQYRDQYKNSFALQNNYNLIRIPYYELKNLNLEMLLPNSSNFLIKEIK